MSDKTIVIHHSPDADDAFMFYGLVKGGVGVPGFKFDHALSDIESLNQRALRGELDVTAVSVHAFAYLKNQYAIMRAGASMGGADYGPRIVACGNLNLKDGLKRKIAIPGKYTSAALALQIYLKEEGISADLQIVDFDKVQDVVKAGDIDAGIIIHEGQITCEREGLTTVLDLGKWWWDKYNLPLPLGVNVVRRALGEEGMRAAGKALKGSIEYSLEHRDEALKYALEYGRGISYDDADKFVGWYVNERTRDIGEDGARSIKLFLDRGYELGIIPNLVDVEFV